MWQPPLPISGTIAYVHLSHCWYHWEVDRCHCSDNLYQRCDILHKMKKVMLLGDSFAGKTTLMHVLANKQVPEKYIVTSGPQVVTQTVLFEEQPQHKHPEPKSNDNLNDNMDDNLNDNLNENMNENMNESMNENPMKPMKLIEVPWKIKYINSQVWDTPGDPMEHQHCVQLYQNIDAFVIVLNMGDKKCLQRVSRWLQVVIQYSKPFIILGNMGSTSTPNSDNTINSINMGTTNKHSQGFTTADFQHEYRLYADDFHELNFKTQQPLTQKKFKQWLKQKVASQDILTIEKDQQQLLPKGEQPYCGGNQCTLM